MFLHVFCLFAMDVHDDARKEQSDLRRVQILVQFIHEKIGCNNLLLVVDQLNGFSLSLNVVGGRHCRSEEIQIISGDILHFYTFVFVSLIDGI